MLHQGLLTFALRIMSGRRTFSCSLRDRQGVADVSNKRCDAFFSGSIRLVLVPYERDCGPNNMNFSRLMRQGTKKQIGAYRLCSSFSAASLQ